MNWLFYILGAGTGIIIFIGLVVLFMILFYKEDKRDFASGLKDGFNN